MNNSAIANLNVSDRYKLDRHTAWTVDLIKEDLQKNAFPYAVCMENWAGDFNLSSVLRSLNCFNGRSMYYLGRKHYDRRGTVGAHHYSTMKHLQTRDQLLELKEDYELVAVENTVPGAVALADVKYSRPPLFILGEEGIGITPETLQVCDKFVFIPQWGSVRSLNAAVAGSIIMYDYVTNHVHKFSNNI